MADIIKINGYSIKDIIAREKLDALELEFDENFAAVVAVAEGKTKAYVTSTAYASIFATDADIVNVSTLVLPSGSVAASDLKIGDIVYLTDIGYPDRWVSGTNSDGSKALSKLETAKVDLTDYARISLSNEFSGSNTFTARQYFTGGINVLKGIIFNTGNDEYDFKSLDGSMTIRLPKASGTVALTSDIPESVSVSYDEATEELTIG